jgi:hypothetical protein
MTTLNQEEITGLAFYLQALAGLGATMYLAPILNVELVSTMEAIIEPEDIMSAPNWPTLLNEVNDPKQRAQLEEEMEVMRICLERYEGPKQQTRGYAASLVAAIQAILSTSGR